MKIYTMVSNSHRFLYDEFFTNSLNRVEPEIELVAVEQDNAVCTNGSYYADGWKESMEQKIDIYLQAVNTNDQYFIWSDVDIEFYSSFVQQCVDELGDYDIAFQEGVNEEYCAGFFICKINNNTKRFFELIKNNYSKYSCDQNAINDNIKEVKGKFLSRDFFNISFEHRQWNGEDFHILRPIKMFHANYTVGLQHKIMLLSAVRTKISELRKKTTLPTKKSKAKIISAYYGILADVTESIKTINITKVNPEDLKGDPVPGAQKFLYCMDKDYKLLHKAVKEGSNILIK
jgi:hypothetical protein